MKKIHKILTLGLLVFTTSCSLQKGYVKIEQDVKNEIIGSDVIKKFIKENPKASIVVTAPISKNKSTESDKNSYIYNVIEKELFQAGFDVKDRGLYNEVVSRSKEINYAELKTLTGTDIILELVKIDTDVPYTTNKWYKKDGKKKIYKEGSFTVKGTTIEFKLTLIEGNKYAGSYAFNFVPCKEKRNDCMCEVAYKNIPSRVYPWLSFCGGVEKDFDNGYEYSYRDEIAEFVKIKINQMIKDIK